MFLVCLLSLKPVFYVFYFFLIINIISFYYLFIFLDIFIYIVCVLYQLNVRSTLEIGRSRLCDYFLVLLFITYFLYRDNVL